MELMYQYEKHHYPNQIWMLETSHNHTHTYIKLPSRGPKSPMRFVNTFSVSRFNSTIDYLGLHSVWHILLYTCIELPSRGPKSLVRSINTFSICLSTFWVAMNRLISNGSMANLTTLSYKNLGVSYKLREGRV